MSITGMIGSLAESFRSQPGLLAVLLVSAAWAGVTYLAVQNRDIRAHEEKIAILERCFPPRERTDVPANPARLDADQYQGGADLQLRTGADLFLQAVQQGPAVQQSGHATEVHAGIWGAP